MSLPWYTTTHGNVYNGPTMRKCRLWQFMHSISSLLAILIACLLAYSEIGCLEKKYFLLLSGPLSQDSCHE